VSKKANNSGDRNDMRKPSSRRSYYIGRNMTKWDKRTGSTKRTRKEKWTIMGRRWNCLYRWKNLHTK